VTIQAQTGPGAQRVRSRPLSPAVDGRASFYLEDLKYAALAGAALLISDAHRYGLIDLDPQINRTRCHEILHEASQRGITPGEAEIEATALRLMAEMGTIRP
jgi:hypothetical protein